MFLKILQHNLQCFVTDMGTLYRVMYNGIENFIKILQEINGHHVS